MRFITVNAALTSVLRGRLRGVTALLAAQIRGLRPWRRRRPALAEGDCALPPAFDVLGQCVKGRPSGSADPALLDDPPGHFGGDTYVNSLDVLTI